MTPDVDGNGAPTQSWRELAVERSLDSARVRAETRVQRFIDAALELVDESETGRDFTVQEVVERSGQSLRSFYQHFGGKQELLLALFEESVRSAVELVRQEVAAERTPRDRLRRFVVTYHEMCRPGRRGRSKRPSPTRALAELAHQLLTTQPAEAARAFAPLVAVFEQLLDEAVEAGVVRGDLAPRRVAGVVLEAITFDAFSTAIGGLSAEETGVDPAEELWDLLFDGLAPRT